MCERVVEKFPGALKHVLDHFKTQEMCGKAVETCLWSLKYVPDNLKTQGMCKKAVEKNPRMVRHVSLITLRWDGCVPEDEKKKQKNCGSNR